MNEPGERKARLKRGRDAASLAMGAVIRYHSGWLVLLFLLIVMPLCIRDFADWLLPINVWVTGFVMAAQLVSWASAVIVVYVLILTVGRLQKRLLSRCCLNCGYPMPTGVGQRCSECGRFAEIALPPE